MNAIIFLIIFFIVHWYLSIFTQTFFLHRYAAHRMFDMSKGWERFFFVFTYLSQGSSYLSAKTYAILHRLHHAHADTELDPHSPSHSENMFTMMWDTAKMYHKIGREKLKVDAKYLKNLPEWRFDKFADSRLSRLLWIAVYVIIYILFSPPWWMFLLLPIHFMMGPIHGVMINWFSHKIGYRNFEVKDTSTNYLPFDFLTMGEGYHNNHHTHSSRADFGSVRWHEIDLTYLVIRFLSWLNIIQLRTAQA